MTTNYWKKLQAKNIRYGKEITLVNHKLVFNGKTYNTAKEIFDSIS